MTISDYTIYCTEEQIKKAFVELDAPLKQVFYNVQFDETLKEYHLIRIGCKLYEIPIAEQMIGWLEEQDIIREVNVYRSANYEGWYYSISGANKQYISINGHAIASIGKHDSRKEATLAAIDAALDYLKSMK